MGKEVEQEKGEWPLLPSEVAPPLPLPLANSDLTIYPSLPRSSCVARVGESHNGVAMGPRRRVTIAQPQSVSGTTPFNSDPLFLQSILASLPTCIRAPFESARWAATTLWRLSILAASLPPYMKRSSSLRDGAGTRGIRKNPNATETVTMDRAARQTGCAHTKIAIGPTARIQRCGDAFRKNQRLLESAPTRQATTHRARVQSPREKQVVGA